MANWLHIIGVTEAGPDALPPAARRLIEQAEIVIGVPRRLKGLNFRENAELIPWDGKFADMMTRILDARNRPTVLLASGDPNWFGIGATLARHLEADEFDVLSAPSSFQLAAAQLNWPLQDVTCISIHGRPMANLSAALRPGARVLALTSDAGTLDASVDLLRTHSLEDARLTVLENLGGPDQRILPVALSDPLPDIGDFYVLAIDLPRHAPCLPLIGLPEEVFDHDGQITKRVIRAATVAQLDPAPGQVLWDVGAGSGSVSIEWLRMAGRGRAICFERDPSRCRLIRKNADRLAPGGLEIVEGDVRETWADSPQPDTIFMGGAVSDENLLENLVKCLPRGGRLVANAVTIGARQVLQSQHHVRGGELVEIAVSAPEQIGESQVMRPALPVLQWAWRKEQD